MSIFEGVFLIYHQSSFYETILNI